MPKSMSSVPLVWKVKLRKISFLHIPVLRSDPESPVSIKYVFIKNPTFLLTNPKLSTFLVAPVERKIARAGQQRIVPRPEDGLSPYLAEAHPIKTVV